MTEPQMTNEQEALLDEAVKYAQLFEQQAQELSTQGNALAIKVECLSKEQEELLSNAID
jgi:hypothetical protein